MRPPPPESTALQTRRVRLATMMPPQMSRRDKDHADGTAIAPTADASLWRRAAGIEEYEAGEMQNYAEFRMVCITCERAAGGMAARRRPHGTMSGCWVQSKWDTNLWMSCTALLCAILRKSAWAWHGGKALSAGCASAHDAA